MNDYIYCIYVDMDMEMVDYIIHMIIQSFTISMYCKSLYLSGTKSYFTPT